MHSFHESQLDSTKCAVCKRTKKDHTSFATCEACGKLGPCELFVDMLLCAKKCYPDEIIAQKVMKESAEERVKEMRAKEVNNKPIDLLARAQKVDQSIELSTDIFNAETEATILLCKEIDEDSSITNKPLAKAQLAMNRIKTFQQTVFEAKQAIVHGDNGMRANQVFLNQIINELRIEEREQFKLKDISYSSKPPKTVKVKSPGTKKAKQSTKIDLVEVNVWAAKLGIAGNAIHAMMVQRGCTAEAAARIMARLLEKNID